MPTAEQIQAANEATVTALPFAEYLASRLNDIADGLRRGGDAPALSSLGESTSELNDFMTYLSLVSELVDGTPELEEQLTSYTKGLAEQLQSLEEPLANLDLVEVADTLELDLVRNLEAYPSLHQSLTAHLSTVN